MDVKLLKLNAVYTGKYGPSRRITRLSKTHLYYVELGSSEEQKTQNEKFAKWATGEAVLVTQLLAEAEMTPDENPSPCAQSPA